MAVQVLTNQEVTAPEPQENVLRNLSRAVAGNRKAVAGIALLTFFVLVALLAPFIAPYDPNKLAFQQMLQPSSQHLLGTTGACDMALKLLSGQLAGNAGVSAEEAAKEWAANVIPGITMIPSGTWGLNRAQEQGCTYCAGG